MTPFYVATMRSAHAQEVEESIACSIPTYTMRRYRKAFFNRLETLEVCHGTMGTITRNGLYRFVVKNWLARKHVKMELLNIHGAKLANIGMLLTLSVKHSPHMVLWALRPMAERTQTRFATCRIKHSTRDV